MEVMQRPMAAEQQVAENSKEVLRHLEDDLEKAMEEALLKRRSSTTIATAASRSLSGGSTLTTVSSISSETTSSGGGDSENKQQYQENRSIYLDKNEDKWKCRHCAWAYQNGFPQIDHNHSKPSEFDSRVLSGCTEILEPVDDAQQVETSNDELELALGLASDEEVVELEFETAVEAMHTRAHSKMVCPNCTHQITKVFIVRPKIPAKTPPAGDLYGCLSCFSIFVSIGNRLNPFPLFGAESSRDQEQPMQDPAEAPGKKFDLFWPFGKERDPENVKKQEEMLSSTDTAAQDPRDEAIGQGKRFNVCWPFRKEKDDYQNALTTPLLKEEALRFPSPATSKPIDSSIGAPSENSDPDGDVIIDVANGRHGEIVPFPGEDTLPETGPMSAATPTGDTRPLVATESGSSRSVEIVKSVVYGGLMESMASLSVVSSAAASDSTTLNIAVLGLANLVGGLVVLAHNLKDLRYGDSGQTDEVMEARYRKELGSKQHFPLHALLAVISYIIFGAIPPALYVFTFGQTNDRDLKMLAVAGASLLCVFFLAIGKAYGRGERSFAAYFKTASYYVTNLVMVAGISFAVGELAERMVQELGWRFDPPAPVSGLHSDAVPPNLGFSF